MKCSLCSTSTGNVKYTLLSLWYLTHPSSPCHVHRRPLAFFLIKPKQQPLPPPQQLPFPFPSLSSSFFSLIARTNEKDPRVQAQTPGLNPFPVHPPAKPVAFRVPPVTPSTFKTTPISNLISCLKTKAKSLCFSYPVRGYSRLGYNPVPKGQMAVYVGQKDGVFQRVLVPVIYFNHPLFGDLLREAEEEYGFTHPGGITIPCRISEFERVQTRIAAGNGSRRLLTWMKASWC